MGKSAKSDKAVKTGKAGVPSEKALLEFIQTAPSVVGKREIARHFGLSGEGKIALKAMLKKLEQDGRLAKSRRKLIDTTSLPAVTVIEIIGIDRDGEIYGEPSEWDERVAGKAPQVLVVNEARQCIKPPGKGDRVLAKIETAYQGDYKFTARIIRTLSDTSKRVLGVYRVVKGSGARLIPVDKKARNELQVRAGDDLGAVSGELVEAEIVKDRGRGLPLARVRERLGDMNDQRNISLIAIHHHSIPNQFPPRVLAEADALAPFAMAGRLDLRKMPLITIDPADARDHDDAVWATPDDDPKNPGGFQVIVAIADVATYVRPASALDREARVRGNSVYFPDRVVPMLPERISTDLCSLREAEDRPALACFLAFDKSGQKKSHRFARVAMRSAAKLAYEEAQAAIDGKPNDKTGPLLEPVLRPLWAAYGALLKARQTRAPLELDLPERRLVLDAKGHVVKVVTPDRLDAHKLIEEFMIQANVAAAEELEAKRVPLLYRVHDQPSAEKTRALSLFLKTLDLNLPLGQVIRPRNFNALLKEVQGKDYQQMVNDVVLRSQAQALYSPQNMGHFGLALRSYAHFTSPIRRYADLIVHRALITALKLGDDGLSTQDMGNLRETADMISDAERRAMAAERETTDRLVASFLAGQTGSVFKGRIAGVVGAGLFVKLSDTGADGFVPVSSLGGEYFVFNDIEHALVGQRSGATFQLGDDVEVRLVEVAPVSGGLRFEMVSEGRAGSAPAGRKARKTRLSQQSPRKQKRR
jgi:ribonuclease R